MKVEGLGGSIYIHTKREETRDSHRDSSVTRTEGLGRRTRRWSGSSSSSSKGLRRRERKMKRRRGRAKGNGASMVYMTRGPASFPVLIGCWLVAGARHSPETCRRALAGAPACSLRPPLPLVKPQPTRSAASTRRSLSLSLSFLRPVSPSHLPVAQRRIKGIRDLERDSSRKSS